MSVEYGSESRVDGVVYLVQLPPPTGKGWTPDISRASDFGRVKMLLRDGERASYRPGSVLGTLRTRLAGYRPSVDYILYAGGDPWGLALVGIALRDAGHSSFRFLRYERSPARDGTYCYVPVEVPLPSR